MLSSQQPTSKSRTTRPTDGPTAREVRHEDVTGEPTGGAAATDRHGYSADKAPHLKRMARVEGQVRGIRRMIDEDTYCTDVLTQVSAVTKALQAVSLALLDEHLAHCVAGAVAADSVQGAAKLAEASQAIARLVRS